MKKRFYNINNLMTFSVVGPGKKVDYVHRQYSYFQCKKPVDNVDIEVRVGRFDENKIMGNEYEVVNRKYRVRGDTIFAEDSYKAAKWKFLIAGLQKRKTQIFFDGNYWGYYILYKFFIEPVIRLKLNDRGYFMIHSSSVFVDGKAFVFPASPSVGKTSTMLNWLHSGMGFIADEYTIIKDGQVFSYPTPLRLHDYNLKANPYICEDMLAIDKLQISIRTWIFRLSFGYADVTHEVDIWNVIRGVKIQDKAPLGQMVIFTKYSGEKVHVKKVSKKKFIEKLLIIDRFETTRFNEYLDAYYYVNDVPKEERFWDRMESNLLSMFSGSEYQEINIPAHYTEETFKDINEVLGYKTSGVRGGIACRCDRRYIVRFGVYDDRNGVAA